MLRSALIFSAMMATASVAEPMVLAPTPPMGWNSWDAYGLTVTEADFRANVEVLRTLRPFGWTYAVIDEGWYMANPFGAKLAERQYQLDGHGLLMPALARFPSAADGHGLQALGAFVHAQGLKFGVHVVRGIPKDAVAANLPIAGSAFRASDAADTTDTCPWDDGNYGVRDNPAGQVYYDSMVRQYADWGVDYIKIDCIADHPYKASEIRQVSLAIQHSGRAMVLSLSPGPTNITHAEEVGRLSQMWRIADDSWDGWDFSPNAWPNGVLTGFRKLAEWHSYARPGAWPDADMLPFGSLTPHPGWGSPRQSRLTQDETRTMFTLWAVARSPLILGANLTKLDGFLRTLLTNRAVIAVNQTAWESYPVEVAGQSDVRAWMALSGSRQHPVRTMAVFNLADSAKQVAVPVEGGARHLTDLWSGRRLANGRLQVRLPAHGSAIYRVE
jgi:alpha-galactosidase